MKTEIIDTNILIYGAGAVGLGIASCLLKAGAKLDILARPDTADSLRRHGLIRTGLFGQYTADPSRFTASASLDDFNDRTYDLILVCTKSHGTAAAAKELHDYRHILTPAGVIVLFQNGWGNAEIFTARFPKQKIYSARVITGFTRTAPHAVEITVHADAIHIGSLFDNPLAAVEPLAAGINSGGIPCITTADIEKDLWAKMLYNCALNPLGAILGVPYGTLAASPDTREIMNTIIEEIYTVMTAAGFSTHWQTAKQYEDVFYNKLVPPTAAHHSSTLQDLKAGKKTEIEALTGQILKLAEIHHIPTPCNTTLYRLIQFLQNK
ncbi:MAG: 2-dehydropantoate 2-reductase [Planctomycetes bacterium]|nr:2-dehydropantoate 2-reductase [Planctomycetota bacterium]